MIKQGELSNQLRIYIITDQGKYWRKNPIELVRTAIQGGATCIQFRYKGKVSRHAIELGKYIQKICTINRVLFIVNDHIELVELLKADGLHVGKNDISVQEARYRLGPSKILGRSFGKDDVLDFPISLVNYLGVGPIYETPTKKDAGRPCGIQFPDEVRRRFNKPVVAIGGITTENIHAVSSHADGVALISSIAKSINPLLAVRNVRLEFHKIRQQTEPI